MIIETDDDGKTLSTHRSPFKSTGVGNRPSFKATVAEIWEQKDDRIVELSLALRGGIKAAKKVFKSWEKGDLAEAVSRLQLWVAETEEVL